MNDIAIVRLSALGDVALLVPIVRTLRAAWPRARLSWVIGSGAHELVAGLEGVEFLVIDKRETFSTYLDLRRRLRTRRFDAVLGLQASLRANLIYPLLDSPLKLGFDRARARDGQWLFTNARIRFAREHLLDSFFAFLEFIGIAERELRWELPVSEADRAWAQAALPAHDGPLLAINPCASKAERDWFAPRYVTVIREAQRRWGAHVVLTGGNSAHEAAVGAQIAQAVPSSLTNLIGCTRPKQLAALLERVDCLLAPDTGPVHIAVATGTPVVGMYAVAPATLSGPYGQLHRVVDRYDEAVRRILNMDPEKVDWRVRVHHREAMALIEPDAVLEKLAAVFQ